MNLADNILKRNKDAKDGPEEGGQQQGHDVKGTVQQAHEPPTAHVRDVHLLADCIPTQGHRQEHPQAAREVAQNSEAANAKKCLHEEDAMHPALHVPRIGRRRPHLHWNQEEPIVALLDGHFVIFRHGCNGTKKRSCWRRHGSTPLPLKNEDLCFGNCIR